MRLIRICLTGAYFGAFHPMRSWNAQSIPATASDKNPTKSAPCEVEDFKKQGFAFNRGTKRSQYFRIGEYFNEG